MADFQKPTWWGITLTLGAWVALGALVYYHSGIGLPIFVIIVLLYLTDLRMANRFRDWQISNLEEKIEGLANQIETKGDAMSERIDEVGGSLSSLQDRADAILSRTERRLGE